MGKVLTYGNNQGSRWLEELEDMKRDIKVLQSDQERHSQDRLEILRVREEVVSLRNQVQDLARESEGYLNIRRIFFETYKRQYTDNPPNQPTIIAGKESAYHGDVVTDASLFKKDNRSDRSLFVALYGIDFDRVVDYRKKSIDTSLYTVLNKHATMLASGKELSEDLKRAFQKFILSMEEQNWPERPAEDHTSPVGRAFNTFLLLAGR